MYQWGGITLGVGLALTILEIYLASRKPLGILPADKRRIWGIFWLSWAMSGLVVALIWALPE